MRVQDCALCVVQDTLCFLRKSWRPFICSPMSITSWCLSQVIIFSIIRHTVIWEFFTAINMKNALFWMITYSSLTMASIWRAEKSEKRGAVISSKTLVARGAAFSFKTSVNFYEPTWRHIPKDSVVPYLHILKVNNSTWTFFGHCFCNMFHCIFQELPHNLHITGTALFC